MDRTVWIPFLILILLKFYNTWVVEIYEFWCGYMCSGSSWHWLGVRGVFVMYEFMSGVSVNGSIKIKYKRRNFTFPFPSLLSHATSLSLSILALSRSLSLSGSHNSTHKNIYPLYTLYSDLDLKFHLLKLGGDRSRWISSFWSLGLDWTLGFCLDCQGRNF